LGLGSEVARVWRVDGEGARRSTLLERLTGEGSSNSETMGLRWWSRKVVSTMREAANSGLRFQSQKVEKHNERHEAGSLNWRACPTKRSKGGMYVRESFGTTEINKIM
jgi:hypothetical protein